MVIVRASALDHATQIAGLVWGAWEAWDLNCGCADGWAGGEWNYWITTSGRLGVMPYKVL